MRQGDLKTGPSRKRKTPVNWKTSKDQRGSDEHLFLAVVVPAKPIRGVDLDFRTQPFDDVRLKRSIGNDGASNDIDTVDRKRSRKSSLHVEFAPPFAARQCRRNHSARGTVLVCPRRSVAAQKRGQNGTAMFLIASKEPVFHGEGHVTHAVYRLRVLMKEIRRQVEQEFDVTRRNQLE